MLKKVPFKFGYFVTVLLITVIVGSCNRNTIPETAFVRYTEAVNLYNNGEYASARKLLSALSEEYPPFHQSLTLLGKTCFMMDDAEASVQFLNIALETEPASIDAAKWLSRSYLHLNSPDFALETASRALEFSSDDPGLLLLLAKAYDQKGEVEKAILAFERATITSGRIAEVYIEAGDFYRRIGFPDRSLELYRSAAVTLPGNSSLLPAIESIILSLQMGR